MKCIKLTAANGDICYVNWMNVLYVDLKRDVGVTTIHFSDGSSFEIMESINEIERRLSNPH